ncbi:MAG: PilZ domain-containing protein [Spirochaetales bacterium]|nr:PilZ domain-containing protein [Spirochaetales bacterium]
MNRTIVLNWQEHDADPAALHRDREIFNAKDQKEAYLYHIEHSDVDSYIINCTSLNIVDVKSIIRHIQYLNAIITIILYKAEYGVFEQLLRGGTVFIASDLDEAASHLRATDKKIRSTNRIQWPLHAEFWTPSTTEKKRERVMVTSISSRGCFLRTEDRQNRSEGDHLSILFHFRNFDFLAEGSIVRINRGGENGTSGLAVSFKEVSPQTERYIQEIIDEKILSEIMEMIK